MINKKYIKSPLNYIGGKHKLLPQILPLFPQKINDFYDIFGGGFNVGININNANHIIYNDYNTHVYDLIKFLSQYEKDFILAQIDLIMRYYKIDEEHKENYLNLREDFNKSRILCAKELMFYVLICYGFNHNIRFNSKNEFNIPFGRGKSSLSAVLKEKLIVFIDALKTKNYIFKNESFEEILLNTKFNKDDFIYCDPPYLITEANYGNLQWNEEKEKKLLLILEKIGENNKFALSNVITHKGMDNHLLLEWSKKYNVHYLNYHYNNASPLAKKAKNNITQEVLITNY